MELDPFAFLSYDIGKLGDPQHTNLDNDRKMFGPPHDDLCFAFLLHNDCLLPTTSLYTSPPILHALRLHSGQCSILPSNNAQLRTPPSGNLPQPSIELGLTSKLSGRVTLCGPSGVKGEQDWKISSVLGHP